MHSLVMGLMMYFRVQSYDFWTLIDGMFDCQSMSGGQLQRYTTYTENTISGTLRIVKPQTLFKWINAFTSNGVDDVR